MERETRVGGEERWRKGGGRGEMEEWREREGCEGWREGGMERERERRCVCVWGGED